MLIIIIIAYNVFEVNCINLKFDNYDCQLICDDRYDITLMTIRYTILFYVG